MVHPSGMEFLIHDTVRLIKAGVPGAIVECGVWKCGASLAALLAQRHALGRVERTVYLLDSFEGLPAVKEKDGPLGSARRLPDHVALLVEQGHRILCRRCPGPRSRVDSSGNAHGRTSVLVLVVERQDG